MTKRDSTGTGELARPAALFASRVACQAIRPQGRRALPAAPAVFAAPESSRRIFSVGGDIAFASAFTMVELMLSIAMALILLVGINQIFKITADTVAAGGSLAGIMRDSRGVQSTLAKDLLSVPKDTPVFIINSTRVSQYLNAADEKANGYLANPLIRADYPGYNAAAPVPQSAALYNERSHRADTLSFLASYAYSRRTADDGSGQFSSATAGADAYVSIGHAAQPLLNANPPTQYDGPTSYANIANAGQYEANAVVATSPSTMLGRMGAYASDWLLARSQLLVKDPNNIPTDSYEPTPAQEYAFSSSATPPNSDPATVAPPSISSPTQIATVVSPAWQNLAPFSYNSQINSPSTPTNKVYISQSRYDLIASTPEALRARVSNAIRAQRAVVQGGTGTVIPWWNSLAFESALNPVSFVSQGPSSSYQFGLGAITTLVPTAGASGVYTRPVRYNVNLNYALPITPEGVAKMTPFLLQHASQFIVEYAGDYIQQDENPADVSSGKYGNMTGVGADGTVDWVYDTKGDWAKTYQYSIGDVAFYGATPTTGNWYQCVGASPSVATTSPLAYNTPVSDTATWSQLSAGQVGQLPKRIRWYGLPRCLTGTGYIRGARFADAPTAVTSSLPVVQEIVDTVPLRDYYYLWNISRANGAGMLNTEGSTASASAASSVQATVKSSSPGSETTPPYPNFAPHEAMVDFPVGQVAGTTPDYYGVPPGVATTPNMDIHEFNNTGATDPSPHYTCVWTNDVPAMVRILVKFDDPDGQLQDGPWYEYVFQLK